MAAYRVAEGTQVNFDGVTYRGGEVVEAPEGVASPWVAGGLVETVDEPAGKKPRAAKPVETNGGGRARR